MKPSSFVVMGVSGCGKSTVGQMLAEALGWTFSDADDFHPPENIAKMKSGTPLNDADRQPWLEALNAHLLSAAGEGQHVVLACSALKQAYRDTLSAGVEGLVFLYLKGSFEQIHERMSARAGHFMPSRLLESQFATLEEPSEAWAIDVALTPEEIVQTALDRFNRES